MLAGYGISSLVRPLIAVARSWPHVFAVRVIDRVGKGIRSAPRDAMLATWTTPATRGKVYGFHRAMDHAGAVLGPLLASLFLFFYPGEYRTLFALTIVPGAIAVILLLFVREEGDATSVVSGLSRTVSETVAASGENRTPSQAFPRELNAFFIVLTLFTLGNSTDAFLLLKLTEVAGSPVYIPLMWAGLHVVKAAVSVVGGRWSDRIGRRAVIACGWIIYAFVYVGFAVADSLVPLLVCFFTYGLYFGFTEGTEKALVADLAPASRRGFAFGMYNAVVGAGGLVASVLFGVLWSAFGPAVAFGVGAALSVAATALLFVLVAR